MRWLLSCLGVFVLVVLGCLILAIWAASIGLVGLAVFWEDFIDTISPPEGL